MADNKKSNRKNNAQEILKKIQQETQQQKRRKALNILEGKQKAPTQPAPKVNYFNIFKSMAQQSWTKIVRRINNQQYQKTVLLTGFLVFSIYVAWKIESKYDNLRKKAVQTKTFKEVQIQKQDEYINTFLSKKQFEAVPITDEPQVKNTYKYQQQQGVFDTKDYLLEQIAKQYRQGNEIDKQMQKQLREKGLI